MQQTIMINAGMHQPRNEQFEMKFSNGDPNLLGVLSQRNFL